MKIKIYALVSIAVLSLVFSSASAQDNDDNKTSRPIEIELADEAAVIIGGYRITISEAIRKAIESNHDILSGKYDVAMTDTDYQKFQSKYSAYFNAEGGISSSEYPELMYNKYGKNSKSAFASASLAKTFSSGTTVSAGVKHTYSSADSIVTNSTTGQTSTYNSKAHNPVVFATVEQELLKNAFGYNDRKMEDILKNSSQMQKDAIIYNLSLVVVGVIVDYWNVIVYKTNMDNADLMLRETKRVRRIVTDNVRLGLAEQFELNFWNSRVASSEAALALAEQQYRDGLRKFLQAVDLQEEITMQEKAILSSKLPVINSEEAIKTAYAKRADYLNAIRSLENAKLQMKMYENEALPSLKGSVSVSSMDYNESLGESYGNTGSAQYPTFEAKIALTYPLDDSSQKVNERNSGWMVEQAKTQVSKYQRIVKDDVTSKIERIDTSYKLYQKAREARVQAEIYYGKMLTNLRRGRFTAAYVRDALDSLVNSRAQELQLLVAFNASLLDFEVSKNQLFETYAIDVEKYIPKEN